MGREFASKFYHSKEWKAVRSYIMLKSGGICEKCGAPAEEVHHKIHLTRANINDLNVNLNPDNLVALCRDCHFRQHDEDRIEGAKAWHVKHAEEKERNAEFVFDENGFLVRNTAPVER